MTTPIIAKPRSTVDQAITWVKNTQPQRVNDVIVYVREIYRLAAKVGYDPTVFLAQAAVETGVPGKGPFESDLWINDLNPAGIGMTDSGKQSYRAYKSGIDAARVHVTHMGGYVEGPNGRWLKTTIYKALDPRWKALTGAGYMGKVKNVEDLGSGMWATQDSSIYAKNILANMAAIIGSASPTPTPGTGTVGNTTEAAAAIMPPLNWIGTQNYHARGMDPVALWFHITDDEILSNTVSWFQDPTSDASSHFVIDRDGTTYQFVSSLNAAWTNGDVQKPDLSYWYCQLMNGKGVNWNNGTITFELVNSRGDKVTDAQVATAIGWAKYFTHADIYGKTIGKNRGSIGSHSYINSVSRPYCDGDPTIQDRIITALGGDPNDKGRGL